MSGPMQSQVIKPGAISGTVMTAYTPTGLMTTNVAYTGYYQLIGDLLHVEASAVFSGATDAQGFTLSLPTGFTANTSKIANANSRRSAFGFGNLWDGTGTRSYNLVVVYSSTSRVTVHHTESTNQGQVSNTAPITIDAATVISINFMIPVL